MREIKFRVWDMSDPGQHKMIFLDPKDGWSSVWLREDTQTKPMQYTGLKDKNGVEVYEGDILDFDPEEFGAPNVREAITIDSLISGNHLGALSDIAKYRAVIGNIYEHSELLEAQ